MNYADPPQLFVLVAYARTRIRNFSLSSGLDGRMFVGKVVSQHED